MIVMLLLGGSMAQAQFFNVPMTGYNADIVADGTSAGPLSSTTEAVDGTGTGSFVFVASDFAFGATACGTAAQRLPASGTITSTNATNSTGITYVLQGYGSGATTNNNALRLLAGASGTLTPTASLQAGRLYLVCLGGSGASTLSVQVNYTDATSESVSSLSAPDWCGGPTTYRLTAQQYYRIPRSATGCSGSACQYLYEVPVTLSAASLTRTIQNIVVTNSSGGILNLMAVGAQSPCATPAAQATALNLTPVSPGQINGTFSAAAGSPAGYVVVRYTAGSTPVSPVNGVTYSAGNTLGTGKVVAAGATTSFSATGLNGNTAYDFYVYSYNTGATCIGPVYNTTAPLTGTATTNACGTMSGTVAVGPGLPNTYPGGFTSLTNALSYISANGLGGNTILELQSGYDGTAPNETFPITFPVNACINSGQTLTVRPAASASGLTITNSTAVATLQFLGATYVTIDGRPGGTGSGMSVPNTSNLAIISAGTGVGSVAIKMANDATNNTIQYCDLQGANNTNGSNTECGVVFIGTTNVAGGTGNDNNAISHCNIHGNGANLPSTGLYSYGYTGSAISLASTFNDNNTVSDCNIYDFFLAGGASTGLRLDGGTNAWTIMDNRIFQTATRTYTAGATHRALWISPSSGGGGNGFTIANNTISGNAPGGGGTYNMTTTNSAVIFYGMDISVIGSVGAIPATATSIQNNTLTNFSLTSGGSTGDFFRFISINSVAGNVNIGTSTGNTLGSTTTAGVVSLTANTTNASTAFGIRNQGTGTTNIANNKVGGITVTGSASIATQFTAIASSAGVTNTIESNLIGSNTVPFSIDMASAYSGTSNQSVTGILVSGGTSYSSISGNTVSNLRNQAVTTGAFTVQARGIIISSTAPAVTAVANNTVKNLTNASGQSNTGVNGALVGIAQGTTNGACNVTGNTVYSLVSSAASGDVRITGINFSGTTGATSTIAKNFVHSLYAATTSTAGNITGLNVTGGATNILNNMVSLGYQPDGVGSITTNYLISGISAASTAATNIYYNSVYVGGTGVTGNANNSFALNRSAGSGTYSIRNNIFSNVRSFATVSAAAPANGNFAIYLAATSGTTISNNLYQYAGVSGNSMMGRVGTTNQVAYATNWLATGDANSQAGDPQFLAPTGTPSAVNLHLSTSAGLAESAGTALAGFNDDYDGDIRQGSAGYAGSGTAPDLGADEFAGTSVIPVFAATSINPPATSPDCAASTAHTVTATITAGGAALTGAQINYTLNGAAQAPIAMSLSSGTGAAGTTSTYNGTIPAVTPANAVVVWSITASTASSSTTSATASYQDAVLTGIVATANASSTTICGGAPINLTLSLSSTQVPATYTAPPAVTFPTSDEDLGNVTITQGATVLLNNTSTLNSLNGTLGTATGTAGSFSNWTALGTTDLAVGTTYNIAMSSINASNYSNHMAAWIDYNRDGDFNDAGENIHLPATTTNGNHTENSNFTVPASANNGVTRMRVYDYELTGTPANNPTVGIGYGEYEEYLVRITGSTNNGGGGPVTVSAYSWSDGAAVVGTTNPLTVTATTTATYTGTATVSNCPIQASVGVTVNPMPAAPTATNSAQCGPQAPTAAVADPNGFTTPTFKWYAASTGGTALQSSTATTYTTSINATTTFYVSVVNPTTSCESNRTAVTVTVTQGDAVSITGPASICKGSALPLSVTQTGGNNNAYVFTWSASPSTGSGVSGSPTGASQSFTPTAGGTYVYSVSGNDGSCIATASISVNVQDLSGSTFAVTNPACGGNAGSTGTITVTAADAILPTNTTVYSNDFTSSTLTSQAAISGAGASITGGILQLTPNTTGSLGGLLVQNSAAAPNPTGGLHVEYDFITTSSNSSGADGMSWSFGDDVVATPSNSAGAADGTTVGAGATFAENGSGTKLKVAFDAYGGGIPGKAGIYVMYNNPIVNQNSTPLTSTMLAYSTDLSWQGGGTSKHITINVDNAGKLTVSIGGVAVTGVSNIQLPAAYINVNKSTWKHAFSARTGGISMTHQLDNLLIQYLAPPYSYEYSIDGTTYQSSNAFAQTSGTYPVYVRYAGGNCPANLGNATIAPAPAFPTVTATPGTAALCGTTTSASLTASGADTYTWSPATGLSATTGATVTASPTASTTYSVIGTTTAGCADTATVSVAVATGLTATNATATPSTICSGSSSQLMVSGSPTFTYCVPGTSVGSFHWVQSFSVTGGSPLITNNASGQSASPYYTNYGTTKTTGNAVVGTTYTISAIDASTTTDYGNISVFVDYNQDGSFDSTERVFGIYDAANLTSPYSGTFVIPATAYNGVTKVRVRSDWAKAAAAKLGCETYNTYGETEDYTINITGGTQNPNVTYAWTPPATLSNSSIANPVATPQNATPGVMDSTIYTVAIHYSGCTATKNDTVVVKPSGQWLGLTSDWNAATNWCGGTPTASSDAIIPNATSVPNSPTIMAGNTGVVNNIQLNNGSVLTVASSGTLDLHGNVNMGGMATFSAAGGTVNFAGNATQTILPGFTVGTLNIGGGSAKMLSGDVTVSGALNFTSGMIDVGSHTLELINNADINGAGSTSYVKTSTASGRLSRNVAGSPVEFPVGNTSYNPAILTNAGTADQFTVGLRDQVQQEGNTGNQIDPATTYAVDRTWDIEEAQPGGSDVTLKLQWSAGQTNSTSFDYSHVYISHYDGSGWDNPYPYAFMAPAANGAGPYSATRTGITSFSPFAVGSAGGSSPLPVTLVRLEATNQGTRNKVEWESATEHDLASYIVERSIDGQTFVRMDEVNAVGKAQGYITYDNNPAQGLTYYRLKMVDYSGAFVYSQTVKAFLGGGKVVVTATPNPVRDVLTVNVYGAQDGQALLTDVSGRVVSSTTVQSGVATFSTGALAAGTYFLKWSNGTETQTVKVSKQ